MKYIINTFRLLFLTLFILLLLDGKVNLWLTIFGVSLIAALILGRIYCSYVCPMNTMMIPAERLSKRLNLQIIDTPLRLKSRPFAWVALIASIMSMFIAKRLFHISIPILPIWLVISVIVTLRFKPEVFHNFICPFGSLQRIVGRYAIISKSVDADACIGCKLCESVCPANAILVSSEDRKAKIATELCHQCDNCRNICPKNAIRYSKYKKKPAIIEA